MARMTVYAKQRTIAQCQPLENFPSQSCCGHEALDPHVPTDHSEKLELRIVFFQSRAALGIPIAQSRSYILHALGPTLDIGAAPSIGDAVRAAQSEGCALPPKAAGA